MEIIGKFHYIFIGIGLGLLYCVCNILSDIRDDINDMSEIQRKTAMYNSQEQPGEESI